MVLHGRERELRDTPERRGWARVTGSLCEVLGQHYVQDEGLGKGSLFHFTVPLAGEHAQRGDVLVVEDDSGFAHLLEAELWSSR